MFGVNFVIMSHARVLSILRLFWLLQEVLPHICCFVFIDSKNVLFPVYSYHTIGVCLVCLNLTKYFCLPWRDRLVFEEAADFPVTPAIDNLYQWKCKLISYNIIRLLIFKTFYCFLNTHDLHIFCIYTHVRADTCV